MQGHTHRYVLYRAVNVDRDINNGNDFSVDFFKSLKFVECGPIHFLYGRGIVWLFSCHMVGPRRRASELSYAIESQMGEKFVGAGKYCRGKILADDQGT